MWWCGGVGCSVVWWGEVWCGGVGWGGRTDTLPPSIFRQALSADRRAATSSWAACCVRKRWGGGGRSAPSQPPMPTVVSHRHRAVAVMSRHMHARSVYQCSGTIPGCHGSRPQARLEHVVNSARRQPQPSPGGQVGMQQPCTRWGIDAIFFGLFWGWIRLYQHSPVSQWPWPTHTWAQDQSTWVCRSATSIWDGSSARTLSRNCGAVSEREKNSARSCGRDRPVEGDGYDLDTAAQRRVAARSR